jgi:ubiquinone biosynthesis protein UbiJ
MKVGELHTNRESGERPDPVVESYRAEAAAAWKFHAVMESEMRHRVEEISALRAAIKELEGRLSKMERNQAVAQIPEYL